VSGAPERALARGAVAAVARTELRRHWVRLLLVGLAAGLLGSAVVGVALVARRTATAYDRLAAATDMEDAGASVFGDPALVDDVRALPEIAESSVSTMFVGGVTGPGVIYLAVRSSPLDGLGQPAVIEGRVPDPASPEEAVLLDDLAAALDMGVGSSLELCLLTSEEFASFDTGFGEPDGPCPTLQVVGIGRIAGTDTSTGIYAGPGFAERYGDGTRAGTTVEMRLDDGAESLPSLAAAVAELAAANPIGEGAEEFPSVALTTPDERREAASTTAQVLVGGLLACAAVAALVGLLLIGQALGRQFEADAADQQIEGALGMTPAERCLARVLPALVTATIAAAVTFGGALVAGIVEPLGPLGDLEPHPGWAPNVAGALAGSLAVAAAALALAALAAWRAGRSAATTTVGTHSARRVRPALVGGAATSAGLSLGLGRGRGPGRLPVRATLATVVVGVAGVTAALTFAASLDRLGDEPARWGWTSDVIVVDARAETVAEIAADPRVGATSWLHQAEGTLDGGTATLYSFEEGTAADPGWTVLAGRPADGPDEVLLGPKLADDLGAGVGDEVELALADGGTRPLEVVGIGIGSTMGQEGFANSALVTPEALDGAQITGMFDELLVRAAPGEDVEALVGDLAVEYELSTPAPPDPVQDVLDLDRIPDLLAAYLAFVALAAMANGLAVVVRRRSRDLATLRAIGLTPRQVVGAVLSAALATAAIGLVIGVPLGLGIGRLVWWVVADRVGLATDVLVPVAEVALVVVGALVVAVAASVVPALRAVRVRPGVLLRAE
jgi:putative ABC transport system permease protein